MSQAQEMESIDRFVIRFKPSNASQQKLIQDWRNWYLNLTWYQKNMDSEIIKQAKALHHALISDIGADSTKVAENFTKKGSQVPLLTGYRRAYASEITPAVQSFAKSALANFATVSRVKGEAAAIGMRYSSLVNGKQYLAQCEWHFDNHPKGGGAPYWHMGTSIFVPTNPIAKPVAKAVSKTTSLFRTSDPSLAALSTSNPYA